MTHGVFLALLSLLYETMNTIAVFISGSKTGRILHQLPVNTGFHVLINGIIGMWLGKSPILEQLHSNIRWSLKVWGDDMTEKVGRRVVKEYADRIADDERSSS